MTISIQNTITESILATLKNISKANGFQTDVDSDSVRRGIRTDDDFQGNFPALSLWKYKNKRKDSFQSGSEIRLQFRLWGYAECDSMLDDFDPLDKLAADVEKILMDSTYNAEYYTNTFIGDTTFFEAGTEDNFGVFE